MAQPMDDLKLKQQH